ncbi:hypothetical protein [Campylobacter curvus]|uniref:hypothetical protein n=1 Tax=Campylobacter curvus TaxID=200 RepID=UPI0001593B97|nr:hypothetical protein [Campylobacter curvus]
MPHRAKTLRQTASTLISTSELAITEPTPMIQSAMYRAFATAIPSAVAIEKSGPGLMRARKCAVTTVNMVAKISFVLFP